VFGNKNLKNRNELDFCKRQTAADFLKRDPTEKIETLGDKADRLVAMLCDPRYVLVDRLAKRGEPVGAANSADLCKARGTLSNAAGLLR